jgi:integrase/recombinase XerD
VRNPYRPTRSSTPEGTGGEVRRAADRGLDDPAADLDLPRLGRQLPKNVMKATEAQRVFDQPDVRTTTGIRDRAMLEVLYATGIRRSELCNLTLDSIDGERGVLTVRKGKGNKDRVVPILPRAIAWVERYVANIRPTPQAEFEHVLFLTVQGRSITPNRLTMIVREYIRAADTGKGGSCHAFRHSLATGMLDNGADIRHVQAQLGHADIGTTQIYTFVSVVKLQEVHARTHPLNQAERDDGHDAQVEAPVRRH